MLHPPSGASDDQQLDAEPQISFPRLRRIVAACWLAYVALLYLLATALVARTPEFQRLPSIYYLLHAVDVLLVLGMALSSGVQRHLGRAFLPVVTASLSALPILITSLVSPFAIGPISGTRGFVILRFAPIVLIGVMLFAWNHPWISIVRWNLVLFLLIIAPAVHYPLDATNTFVIGLLQTAGFLTLGYCICVLLKRLRWQDAVPRYANYPLHDYASTLENLTISRERNRVARELRNTLSSLSVQFKIVKAYLEINSVAAQALLEAALAATHTGLQETRRALDAACPLDDLGLRIALCDMVEAAAGMANLRLDLQLPNQLQVLEASAEQTTYRIVQEAIANVVHHAEAQQLVVAIACTEARMAASRMMGVALRCR